ncbi:IclR family transcriptional regulator [Dactylosporangium sp. NPDC049525]|uniref:IclR family transcriptional regulator n=1 Tax=Dactylosporangium sp. NPDC049525 TaxID=3154730 RepID=UPI00341485B7
MPGQTARDASTYRDRNSTAERALDVLQLFTDDKLVWSGAEISERFGVARSTGYRYLKGLVDGGFVEECAGGFRLGPQILELARLARKGIGLSDIARPVMLDLAATTKETVLLTRRSGGAVVCLDIEVSSHPVRISYERGQVLPVNAGAAALVLLAWLPEEDLAALLSSVTLERFTPRTITDPERLRTRLRKIRKDGFALTRGELDADVLGIAAPIRGRGDEIVAAVSIAAPSHRISADDASDLIDAVRGAADGISASLLQITA